MANKNHAVFVGTHCAYWDVDSLNYVGIYTAGDMDNGTFVTLGDMSPADDGAYNFAVTLANDAEFVCGSAPQGYGIDAQVYDDPRYFTNEAGKPIAVKHLLKWDCIEVDAQAFTDGTAPVAQKFAKVVSGKLTPATDNNDNSAHFAILGARTMDVGGEFVPTWVLQKLV